MTKSEEKKSDKKAAIERLIRTNVRVGGAVRVCWAPKGAPVDEKRTINAETRK